MLAGSLLLCCGLSSEIVAQVVLTAPVQVAAPANGVIGIAAPVAQLNPASPSAPPSAALAAEFKVDLRAKKLDSRFVESGKDNGTIEPSSEGLRLKLNGGAMQRTELGLTLPVRLCGDFEVTIGYDDLGIGDEPPGRGAGVAFAVSAAGSQAGETIRAVTQRLWNEAQQRNWVTEKIVEHSGSMQQTEQTSPANAAKFVKVRLARSGSDLRVLIDESNELAGGGFREVGKVDFSTNDVTELKLFVHNGNQRAHVKVRLLDLTVKASKLGGAGPVVKTIHNESLPGQPSSIEDGALVLAGSENKKVPLDELLSVDLDRQPAATSAQPAAADAAKAVLTFESGDRLVGSLIELTVDTARLKSSWDAEIEVPLALLTGIELPHAAAAAPAAAAPAAGAATKTNADAATTTPVESVADRWQRELARPGETDTVLVRSRDGALTSVAGSVQAIRDGKLELLFEGQSRNIDRTRVLGIVFAAHPPQRAGNAPFQRFHFIDGQRVSGKWLAIAGDKFELETPWQAHWQIPAASLREVTAHNGRMVYLSELEPIAVEQVPYFGRVRPYRRDQGLSGGGLRIGDETFSKGLAVHSKTVLSFAIDGAYSQFRTTLGFDPAAGRQGRVACRVLGDGRELFVDADVKADEPPLKLDLPVTGVATLVLEIDFGEAEDAGDDVVWGSPRLYREAPATPSP